VAPANNFVRAYHSAADAPTNGLWFAQNKHGILVVSRDGALALPEGELVLRHAAIAAPLHLGVLGDVACVAVTLHDDAPIPSGARLLGLRDLYGRIDESHYAIAGYAAQLLLWQQRANFCMACGNDLQPITNEWGKRCSNCGHIVYPPVNPCTITLVHDGERILMTHKAGWGTRYGLVAGFVEPGETLEENVAREVHEETGVVVRDIAYWRSQPWPFPHQIMCGFYARYAGGTVRIDADELDDARWFTKDDIRNGTPTIPPPLSIARQLIDNWLAQP
jgi:NAD+ diphosphatase